MSDEYYFEMVERVLQNFPLEYSKNYYKNKEELVIVRKEEKQGLFVGTYDNETNIIRISQEESLPHELFHMAFRDPQKCRIKVWEDGEIQYSNGVSFEKIIDNHKENYFKGFTEGFAEYLARKCQDNMRGQQLHYFFTDLLISIYGEDILKYPFQNDPLGFLLDERFYNILQLSRSLNQLDEAKTDITLTHYYETLLIEILENGDKKDCVQIAKMLENLRDKFKTSIISLFKQIIAEYEYCSNPMVSRDKFIEKMEQFLTDPDYKIVFGLDGRGMKVREKVKIGRAHV